MENTGSDFLTGLVLITFVLMIGCVTWCSGKPEYKRAEW